MSEKQSAYPAGDYVPEPGELVSLGGIYVGVVEKMFFSEDGRDYVAKIYLIKNAFQRNASELHTKENLISPMMRPATPAEGDREILMRLKSLNKNLGRFDV